MDKITTILFLVGLLFIQKAHTQDCTKPFVANGNHVGDVTEGGAAAVICNNGYAHGGDPTATCTGGVWVVLPECDPKDCGQPNNLINGELQGDTFYSGTATVECDIGYTGGGAATCGTAGSWTTLPGCTPRDCGNPNVAFGLSLGDTFYGGSPFISCQTGYTGGGTALTCLADGNWEINVSCDPEDCGLPDVENSAFNGDTFYTGTASVACNAGYEGGGSVTCQSNGKWATPLATCDPKDCGNPTIANGQLDGSSSTLYGESANVVCNAGYIGGGAVVCLDTGNWGTLPACNPRDCGTETITNGVLSGSTLYDGSANVVCDTGYIGGGGATCQTDGTWLKPLPACEPQECGPPTISNGQLQPGKDDTFYGGTSVAMCNAGYEGGGVINCQPDATWTANPDPCTPIDCFAPTIDHASFSGETFYTGTPVVTCDPGYDKTGTAAVCNTDGSWTLPTCNAKDCGPLNVANGVFSGTTVYDGSPLITCNTGYDKVGTAVCETTGDWTRPTCEPKDCGDPGIANSVLIGTTVFDGAAFIQCNAGYTGSGSAECLALGIWNPATLPTCTPKDCGTPTVANGYLTGSSLFDGVATIDCDSGYEGGGSITCKTDATWAALPTCEPVDCNQPTIPNGGLTLLSSTKYAENAFVECDSGYELAPAGTGSNVATCLESGNWDTLPVCDPKDCGPLTNPVHGSVSAPVTTYQNVATYTCDSLYQLNGTATLTCEADGNWAPDPPTCDDIDCPALTPPTNGVISTSSVKVGTSVDITCDATYTMFGNDLFNCETGGTWDVSENSMGTCRKDCPALTPPGFGFISTTYVFEGTVVDVTCATAYTLEGTGQISCEPGGVWDPATMPVCTEDCQPLTVPNHGTISTEVLSQGTIVVVTCDTGYTLFGANTLECLTTASWNNAVPNCELDCPKLSPPQNGIIDNYSLSKGTSVLFGCDTGYTLFGMATLTCQPDSTWDNAAPVCLENCPELSYPDNGLLDTLDPRQGTVTNVFCFGGFTLFGAATLTCLTDASWDYPMPECRENCPALTPPTNGAIDSTEVSQTTQVNVNCSDSYTLFGAPLLTCQSDATWDNAMPECRLDCPALTDPAHGYINNTVIQSQGTVVGVICFNLYTLFGESILTCQSDANWDFVVPECKPDCRILVPPSHGSINTTIESQFTVVGVECDTDYTLFGDDTLFCQGDATWDTIVPVCKRDCRSLVEPTNGNMYNSGVSQETEVSFDCDFEYTLFGSAVLICQSDATWNSTEPTCEKDCPPLNIPHGSISTTVVIKDTEVNITCDTDYTLEGAAQLTCITNGVWDYAVPQCTKDCQALFPPTNGYLAAADGGVISVSQGSVVDVFCNENYTAFGDDDSLFGNKVLTCQTNNQWDYSVPTCRINCPPQVIPSNAIFSTLGTYEGIVNVVSCDMGFTRFGNQNITCLPGGFWDKSLPTCRRDCKTLDVPTDGNLDTTDVKEGTIVTTTCNSGYTLIGVATVECLPGGKWNRYLPFCHRECGTLATPANGIVSTGDGTTLGKKASYACLTGYDLSHTNIRVCQADGSWSYTPPTCIKQDCGHIPAPSNGGVTYSNGVTTYLEIATFTCDPGYILTGDRRRLCRKNYSWSHTSPTCVIKNCGSLSNPSHGKVSTTGGTTYGQVANYYCNVGYSLIGVASRTCDSDGRWSVLPPTCQINDCGNLSSPANGEVTFTSTVYNELAFYSCHSGYDLVGTSSRVCQKDATWSSTAPICQIKDCGPLSKPTKGSISYSNDLTTYQEVAVFSCDAGYSLIGFENRTCGANGKWGGSSPTCQIKDCGSLSNPDHGTVNIASGTTYGKKANYFCNFGYTLTGVSQRQCAADGLWSDTEPNCEINDCGNLTNPVNGVVTIIRTTYNEIASYSCYSGFILVGVSQRVCRHDKTWSDSAPTCTIKDCGSPYSIEHGSVVTPLGTEYNDSAVYNCDSNFGLVGDDAILCLASGYWDSPPLCSRDCGLPADLENGKYLLQTDTLTTAIATYSCDNGYNLVGEPNVECLLSGAWESPPVCQIDTKPFNVSCYVTEQCVTSRSECRSDGLGNTKCLCEDGGEIYDPDTDTCLAYCGWLTAPTNGYIVLPSVPSEGQNVTYTCDLGFALDNVTFETRVCLATRQWSGRAPLCVIGCPTPTAPNHGNFDTPEGKAVGRFVYYTCDSTYSLVGEDYRECLADTSWNGNTPLCLKDCSILGNIENGVVDLSDGHWEDSVATYYCDKDYALVGTATRTCEGDSGWSGTEPECIYAIFPDVLLVIACLLIFLVIVDIFIVLACIYMRYKKKKDKEEPDGIMFDDIDDPNADGKHPPRGQPAGDKTATGIPPLNLAHLGPGRSSFRKPENTHVASEEESKQIPQLPRKQKKSVLHRIPKPKPLRKLKRPKFFTSDTPMAPNPTPRTIPNSANDEFADEKIAEMERYLKDDFGTPSSSDVNRRSTADEEKVSIEQVPTSRLPTGDKLVLMDFDDAQAGEISTARVEEPSTSGRESGKDRHNLRERKKLQISSDPPDVLRPHTPMFPQQMQSDV